MQRTDPEHPETPRIRATSGHPEDPEKPREPPLGGSGFRGRGSGSPVRPREVRRLTLTADLTTWARLAGLPAGKVARRLKGGGDAFDAVWGDRWAKVGPRQEQRTMTELSRGED